MAHLWIPGPHAAEPWRHQPLDAAFDLGASARVHRAATPEGESWVLLAPPSVRVNGDPASAGIVALRDRDEICVDGRRLFFSAERLAAVVPYPAEARPLPCPRCGLEITAGTPAVVCPGCATWHHQSPAIERPCWLYADRCTQCDQPTALDAGFRWTPEDL